MNLKDITPRSATCLVGACPALFETDRGTLLVVGRRLSEQEVLEQLAGRVGQNEWVVEIPQDLLERSP